MENTSNTLGYHHTDVVNMSTYNLTEDQMSIPSKGLKFCPTPPEPDVRILKTDMDFFLRRIRLLSKFDNHDSTDTLHIWILNI